MAARLEHAREESVRISGTGIRDLTRIAGGAPELWEDILAANAPALRHFIELRGSRHAEVEIRKLAVKVLQLMQQEAPHIFHDYQLLPLPDGTYEAATEYRKV